MIANIGYTTKATALALSCISDPEHAIPANNAFEKISE
jgi:hypothetical protein